MPAGSVASLPLPQGPCSPFSVARRSPRFTSRATPAGAGSQLPVAGTAQDDPALGRVLLVHKDTVLALKLQRVLVELGWRVLGPASSAEELHRLLERQRALPQRIDCAVVGAGMPFCSDIADRLADEGIGLVWLVAGAAPLPPPQPARVPVVSWPFDRDALLAALDWARKCRLARWQYPVPPPQSA
jgi:hypothetical protein